MWFKPFILSMAHYIGFVYGIFVLTENVKAKDLGTYGAVFKIAEKNLLEQIMDKLQEAKSKGKLESIQKDIGQKMTKRLMDSFGGTNIPRATTYTFWIFDPSVTVSEDLKDHQGTIFAKKGTKINPLDQIPFGEPLIFIDGEDQDQVDWVLHQMGKIILVRGNPIKLEEKIQKAVYFDQQGVLQKKFNLKYYPSIISQKKIDDRVLTIEEIGDLSFSQNQIEIHSEEANS